MLLEPKPAIDPQTAETLRGMVTASELVSGLDTPLGAAAVIDNEQPGIHENTARPAGALLLERFGANPVFEAARLPNAMARPRFRRFKKGMRQGNHLGGRFMGNAVCSRFNPPIRGGIAVTVFLTGPESYDGGELTIESGLGSRRVKGNVGDCVICPAKMLHRVEGVTRGERIAGFLWIQSMVRDPARRQVPFDLVGVAEFLDGMNLPEMPAGTPRHCRAPLTRQWAEDLPGVPR